MTAFLARLDGRFLAALSGGYSAALIYLAEQLLALDELCAPARAILKRVWREIERTPVPRAMAGRHRAAAGAKTWDQDRSARADYEWAMAIRRMAVRMEGHHAWR